MAITNRETLANDIESFILSSETTVKSIINDLGWSLEHMWKKDDSCEVCPLDAGHLVPTKSLQKHVEICSSVKDGYSKEEIKSLPPDPKFCYESCNNVVTVPFDDEVQDTVLRSIGSQDGKEKDTKTKRKIPKTMDRSLSDFTREERLAIYDYAVARSKVVAKDAGIRIEEMNLNFEQREDKEKPKSFLEVLAEQRDYKRRRQSYRAKNVHITKKSYTEVMRDVIEKQMEYLDPETKEGSIETANESSDGHNYRDADSSREFERSYGEREDSRRRRSRSRSLGGDKWRGRSESNRTEDHYRERSRNFDESSRDSRSRKRHRSRTPTRTNLGPKQKNDRRNESVSPSSLTPTARHHRDGSSRHRKKHKHHHHHHHKRKSSARDRD